MLSRTYELDMVPGGIPLSVHLSQYDSDVTLIFQLFASQGILDIPSSGITAAIRGTKRDGNGISAEADFAFVDSIPTVTVRVTKQMTAIAGKNNFELVLTTSSGDNSYELPSANFYLDVERAALDYDTLESKSEIMEIQEIISDADNIIEALRVSQTTQENMAALTQRAETAAASAEQDAGTPIIASSYNAFSVMQFTTVNIPYTVYTQTRRSCRSLPPGSSQRIQSRRQAAHSRKWSPLWMARSAPRIQKIRQPTGRQSSGRNLRTMWNLSPLFFITFLQSCSSWLTHVQRTPSRHLWEQVWWKNKFRPLSCSL